MAKAEMKIVAGQKSWRIASDTMEAYVTETGGQLGPVTFDRKGRKIRPYSVAPWAEENAVPGLPAVVRVLRGDFFCMPFGGNMTPYKGERHPVHGDTANGKWTLESVEQGKSGALLHLSMQTQVRRGRVDKYISLAAGQNVLYIRHRISEMQGPVSYGHHAMLKFPHKPGSGLVSVSPFSYGQVAPLPVENPEVGGYSILKPGAEFTSLEQVPMVTGEAADLSRYPARRGYEDLVLVVNAPGTELGWTSVTFPAEGYVWFALKDPLVLGQTVLWISNGGRHYAPWSGRHVDVLGVEDVTSYFHYGLAESVKANPLSQREVETSVHLQRKDLLNVNYIMGIAPIPRGFDHVKEVRAERDGIVLTSRSGKKAKAAVNLEFLGKAEAGV